MQIAAERYDELQALNKLDNFYDYEKEFVHIWQGLGRQVLEKNLGELPADKRKKNLTTLGLITIANIHPYSRGKHGFQISDRLQELMVYAGQLGPPGYRTGRKTPIQAPSPFWIIFMPQNICMIL